MKIRAFRTYFWRGLALPPLWLLRALVCIGWFFFGWFGYWGRRTALALMDWEDVLADCIRGRQ